jgi:hypothetical protein
LLLHLAREKKTYVITSRPLPFDPAQGSSSPQNAPSHEMSNSIAYRCMGEDHCEKNETIHFSFQGLSHFQSRVG